MSSHVDTTIAADVLLLRDITLTLGQNACIHTCSKYSKSLFTKLVTIIMEILTHILCIVSLHGQRAQAAY